MAGFFIPCTTGDVTVVVGDVREPSGWRMRLEEMAAVTSVLLFRSHPKEQRATSEWLRGRHRLALFAYGSFQNHQILKHTFESVDIFV